MTKHALSASLRVGGYDLVIVEWLHIEHHEGSGIWVTAAREPVAVVVKGSDTIRAYGIDGESLSLETLRERLPHESWRAEGIAM